MIIVGSRLVSGRSGAILRHDWFGTHVPGLRKITSVADVFKKRYADVRYIEAIKTTSANLRSLNWFRPVSIHPSRVTPSAAPPPPHV